MWHQRVDEPVATRTVEIGIGIPEATEIVGVVAQREIGVGYERTGDLSRRDRIGIEDDSLF
jgi:hypothetical protein